MSFEKFPTFHLTLKIILGIANGIIAPVLFPYLCPVHPPQSCDLFTKRQIVIIPVLQVNRRNLTKTPQRGSGRVKIQRGCVGPGLVPPCLRLWASLLELQDAWAPEPFLVLSVAKG